jgi:hypothetical protein
MAVKVATDDQSGPALAEAPRAEPLLHTSVIGGMPPTVEERIHDIIAGQVGAAAQSSRSTQN